MMTTLRSLPAMALAAALLLPTAAAVAQEGSPASPGPAAASPAADPRFTQLAELLPSSLAGRSLADNLTLATGEQLFALMRPEESALLQAVLDDAGRTVADYAAATTWLAITDTDMVVVQAHRMAGVDAAATLEAWVEVLTLNLVDPQVSEGTVAGRPVTFVSDGSAPEVPQLYLFPAGDVVWMVVAADQAVVEEAMLAVTVEEPLVED